MESPKGDSSISLSVVMELENVCLAGRRRAVSVLRALADQLVAAPAGLVGRAELLVGSDPERWPLGAPAVLVAEAGFEAAVERVVYLAPPGADYFALKNAGARAASGEVILFLDSDVIPEPGWLEAVLLAIADPETDVAGSRCYIDGDDLVSRAYAVFGTFPLRDETSGAEVFLNSLAVRPWVMERHPFPQFPLFRNNAYLWKRELKDAGVRVRVLNDARVAHPAPPGLVALFRRSLADGRDHYATRRYAEGYSRPVSLALGLGGCVARTFRKTVRTLWRGPGTGLGPLETIAAVYLCLVSHAARLLGCVASFARDVMRPGKPRVAPGRAKLR